MFCHSCLIRYLNALLLTARIAQATVTAWLAGDITRAFSYLYRFVQLWNGLNPWGRTLT